MWQYATHKEGNAATEEIVYERLPSSVFEKPQKSSCRGFQRVHSFGRVKTELLQTLAYFSGQKDGEETVCSK